MMVPMLGQKQATSTHMLMMATLMRTVRQRDCFSGSSSSASERSMKATSGYTVTTCTIQRGWNQKLATTTILGSGIV